MKPVSRARLLDVIEKLHRRYGLSPLANERVDRILVTANSRNDQVVVKISDIAKIESNEHYAEIYTHAGDKVGTALMTMADVMAYFAPTDLFTQVNQQCIVSLFGITGYRESYLTITTGVRFTLGDIYGPGVRAFLKRHSFRRDK